MKIEIKDAKLIKILEKRGEIFKEIGLINEQLVELDGQRKALGYKMDDLKGRTKLAIDKMGIEKDLKEFEFIAKVYIEKGKAYYDIEDMVEEYKKSVREERKAKEDENTTDK